MIKVETRPWTVRDTFKRLEDLRGARVNLRPVLAVVPPFFDQSSNPDYCDLLRLQKWDEVERRFPRPTVRMHAHWSFSDQPDFLRKVIDVFDKETAKLVCVDYMDQNGVKAQVDFVVPNQEIIIRQIETPKEATLFDKADITVDFLPAGLLRQDINATREEGDIYKINIPGGTIDWKLRMLKLWLDECDPNSQLGLFEQSADPFDHYTFAETGQELVSAILANRV